MVFQNALQGVSKHGFHQKQSFQSVSDAIFSSKKVCFLWFFFHSSPYANVHKGQTNCSQNCILTLKPEVCQSMPAFFFSVFKGVSALLLLWFLYHFFNSKAKTVADNIICFAPLESFAAHWKINERWHCKW